MRWILLAVGALVVWVCVRWVLRVTSGVSQARDRGLASLRRIVPGAIGVEREPGLVVLTAADDRVELDYELVLKAALAHKAGGQSLDAALCPVVEAACLAQTEPEQVADERAEAEDILGSEAAAISDGRLLRVLFGHADEDGRDAALHSARAPAFTRSTGAGPEGEEVDERRSS
ncbi:MAG: hypothetical protein AB8I08_38140 [Sandaracinaceae bacterium]